MPPLYPHSWLPININLNININRGGGRYRLLGRDVLSELVQIVQTKAPTVRIRLLNLAVLVVGAQLPRLHLHLPPASERQLDRLCRIQGEAPAVSVKAI